MKFELPKLPYKNNALEPIISERTIEFHYGKHFQAYINNLNKLIEGTIFENAHLDTIVKESDGSIFNNAAQSWNHDFYFKTLTPDKGTKPSEKLIKAIEKEWDSFDSFKKEFEIVAAGLFGSGWAWLVSNNNGKLSISKESNAGNPITKGLTPLMTMDVWEHAYYLDYQNRRPDHLSALWSIINWDEVSKRYK